MSQQTRGFPAEHLVMYGLCRATVPPCLHSHAEAEANHVPEYTSTIQQTLPTLTKSIIVKTPWAIRHTHTHPSMILAKTVFSHIHTHTHTKEPGLDSDLLYTTTLSAI